MINETVDKNEVNLFESMADEWWDETGSMSFLHAMSEIRTQFIVNEIINNFNIKRKNKILKNINILDIGCGGGIASEPLSRLGANLIGIDESKELIKVAQHHAEEIGATGGGGVCTVGCRRGPDIIDPVGNRQRSTALVVWWGSGAAIRGTRSVEQEGCVRFTDDEHTHFIGAALDLRRREASIGTDLS